jgi:hypothetical protein
MDVLDRTLRERLAAAAEDMTANPLRADRTITSPRGARPLAAAIAVALAIGAAGAVAGVRLHSRSVTGTGAGPAGPTTPAAQPNGNGIPVWDSTHHEIVLMGPLDPGQGGGFGVWTWAGRWSAHLPSMSPPYYRYSSVFLDMPPLHGVVLLGPFPPDVPASLLWNGRDWVRIAAPPFASGVGAVAGVWDAARGRAVVVAMPIDMPEGTPAVAQTWEWDGTTWTRHPDLSPMVTGRAELMAYDRQTSRPALLTAQDAHDGGRTLLVREWDGAAWHALATLPVRSDQSVSAFAGGAPGTGMVCLLTDGAAGGQGPTHTFFLRDGHWAQATPAHEPYLYDWPAVVAPANGELLSLGEPHAFPNDHIHVYLWSGSDWVDAG